MRSVRPNLEDGRRGSSPPQPEARDVEQIQLAPLGESDESPFEVETCDQELTKRLLSGEQRIWVSLAELRQRRNLEFSPAPDLVATLVRLCARPMRARESRPHSRSSRRTSVASRGDPSRPRPRKRELVGGRLA